MKQVPQPATLAEPMDAVLADSRTQSPYSFALRTPEMLRGVGSRPAPPESPLLPMFFAGEENRFASFACQAPIGQLAPSLTLDQSSDAPAQPAPPAAQPQWGLLALSPLLLVGPVGCGKSALAVHLASRLLAQLLAAVPRPPEPMTAAARRARTALLLPGADFARYYARAVEADDMPRFRRDIDLAPVLVIDDVHTLVGKVAAQDELASRIEGRFDAGRPTVLTCRRLPTQVAGLRPLLVSRMLPGLTIPIQLPGPTARRALLQEFAFRRNLLIGQDELDLLAAGLESDLPVRSLEAAVAHVELHCRMHQTTPDVHAIRAAIGSIEPTHDLSADRVAKSVSRLYKLKLSDLKSSTRRQEVVRARSLAMFLTRQLVGSSYHQIGKYFGGRDHTTVLHACRKTEAALQDDAELRGAADEVTEQLKATG